jgi:hypothetical protein
MKKIIILLLLISSSILLSSCMNNDEEKSWNDNLYIEANQWGGAWVPVESQSGAR